MIRAYLLVNNNIFKYVKFSLFVKFGNNMFQYKCIRIVERRRNVF